MFNIKIVEREITRTIDTLLKLDPSGAQYSRCLSSLRQLLTIEEFYYSEPPEGLFESKEVPVEDAPEPEPEPEPVAVETQEPEASEEEETPEPVVEEAPEPEPVHEHEHVCCGDKFEPTKEQVRSLLADAASRGTLIQPIIAKFVPEGKPMRLSSVPTECYPDLVQEVYNAK